jgi:hypothetical protein
MPALGTVAKPILLEFRNAWSRQIRAIYHQTFDVKCPKSLYNLQSLAFLPKVFDLDVPWQALELQTVADKCGIQPECFFHSRPFLAQQLTHSSEFSLLCADAMRYRLEKKQDCCTALRQIVSWNITGWRTLQWSNPKAKAILRGARKGIVCLQETKWSASTATNFLQTYPRFSVAHSPANPTDSGGLSGGVAILIPCTFRLLRQCIITPGKAVAAQIQTRTDQFWIISAYCHPQSVREDCKAIEHWLASRQMADEPCFLLGDFNRGDTLFPADWQCLLDAAQGENVIPDQPTFWGPSGASSLDKAILPMEYLNRGLIQYQIFYDRLFDSSGHACISIKMCHRPPVASSADLPTHMTMPASVFQPGKDQHDTRKVWPSLQSLIRRLSLVARPTFEILQTILWQWWLFTQVHFFTLTYSRRLTH